MAGTTDLRVTCICVTAKAMRLVRSLRECAYSEMRKKHMGSQGEHY